MTSQFVASPNQSHHHHESWPYDDWEEGEGQIRWRLHLGGIFERFAAISTAVFPASFAMCPFPWTHWNSPSTNSFCLFLHTPIGFTAIVLFCLFRTLSLEISASGNILLASPTLVFLPWLPFCVWAWLGYASFFTCTQNTLLLGSLALWR